MDGHELTFATNHLGPFLLTRLLLPALGPAARIINVASRVHFRGRMDLDSVDGPAGPLQQHRGLCTLQARQCCWIPSALARQLAGSGITVNCLHPGVVATNLLPGWLNLHPARCSNG